MAECAVIEADPSSLYPPMYDRFRPGEANRVAADMEATVDCAGQGVVINSSTWAVHPDDDDAEIALSSPTVVGYISSVLVTFTSTAVAKSYRLICTTMTGDNQTYIREHVARLEPTRAYGA